ncbi:MAG: DUF3467 domain-containing protein [Pirellula sp.]
MPIPPSPEDRPDPNENMPAVRARVTDQVARGEISTGVIVVTGGTEFVLDFVRNIPRPNAIVARVVLPHMVMPQFIEALSTNIELYRQRYGELPGAPHPMNPSTVESHVVQVGTNLPVPSAPSPAGPASGGPASSGPGQGNPASSPSQNPPAGAGEPSVGSAQEALEQAAPGASQGVSQGAAHGGAGMGQAAKRQNPQDIYDELKIRDEILCGTYANAVMIGHGPYEFSFDFITNFYPQSAVSCRVFLAAGHIWRLLDSLKQSWEQLRPRLGYPPPPMGPNGPYRQ